jgi:AcrR family transcriptional regulator
MESPADAPRPKRRRDPEASRTAILEAASEVFNERGYARATIREIARRAGVTHGLVMRHFGSKEQLLIEALPGPRAVAEVAPGDLDTLPERIAAAFVAQTEPAADGGATFAVALIRSAASGDEAALPLYAAAERAVTTALREALGPGTEVYANLLSSLAIGVAFTRHVARAGALAALTPDELAGYLAPAVRALLAPAIAAAQPGSPADTGGTRRPG